MYKARMLFSKTGRAAYMSHLDLMSTMQRAFRRAALPVRWSEGFNPHIILSMLVPLSTGFESVCELCDFDFITDLPPDGALEALNAALPEGLAAHKLGTPDRPVGQIAYCAYDIDCGGADERALAAVFAGPVEMEKKSKRGSRTVDLRDYVREIGFVREGESVTCRCTLKAGDDPLNPTYVARALQNAGALPAGRAAKMIRRRILDSEGKDFFE